MTGCGYDNGHHTAKSAGARILWHTVICHAKENKVVRTGYGFG
jgi:hypothetical protein